MHYITRRFQAYYLPSYYRILKIYDYNRNEYIDKCTSSTNNNYSHRCLERLINNMRFNNKIIVACRYTDNNKIWAWYVFLR